MTVKRLVVCGLLVLFLAVVVAGPGLLAGPGVAGPVAAAKAAPWLQLDFTPVATNFLPIVLRPAEPTATPSPTNTPVATNTPLPTATATNAPTGDVRLVAIEYDPPGSDAVGEYVDLRNFEAGAVDMTGWTLRDAADTVFTFPAFTLASQSTVRVWVRSGVDDGSNLYWGRDAATWNNNGDTAILRNAGGVQIDTCTYAGGGQTATC